MKGQAKSWINRGFRYLNKHWFRIHFGYFVPEMEPMVDNGNTLLLGHKNLICKNISDKLLLDDTIYEVTWDGDLVGEWVMQ